MILHAPVLQNWPLLHHPGSGMTPVGSATPAPSSQTQVSNNGSGLGSGTGTSNGTGTGRGAAQREAATNHANTTASVCASPLENTTTLATTMTHHSSSSPSTEAPGRPRSATNATADGKYIPQGSGVPPHGASRPSSNAEGSGHTGTDGSERHRKLSTRAGAGYWQPGTPTAVGQAASPLALAPRVASGYSGAQLGLPPGSPLPRSGDPSTHGARALLPGSAPPGSPPVFATPLAETPTSLAAAAARVASVAAAAEPGAVPPGGSTEAQEQEAGSSARERAGSMGGAGGVSGADQSSVAQRGLEPYGPSSAVELLLGRDVVVDLDDPNTYLGHGGLRGRGKDDLHKRLGSAHCVCHSGRM